MSYEKLVRDLIPDIIRSNGDTPIVRIAQSSEADSLLREKLVEEAVEFRSSGDLVEIADVLEVIYAILEQRGVDLKAIEQLRLKKREERGGFERLFVLTMDGTQS
ncbi:MAG: nucleoside triphosphate pyrophosphohydrolase [Candidatus Thorarchaeota archaeon]|nr:nucleoside triphosphate pyrophosphohydrolase [Candidatus Thorarchaeota archaeon]